MENKNLIDLTVSEIENEMNSLDFSMIENSIDRDYVRNQMFDVIKNKYPSAKAPRYDHTEFTLYIEEIGYKEALLVFKLSTKSTGKTVDVTRLRKKDVVKPNKIKLSQISVSVDEPCFNDEANNEYKVSLKMGWSSGSDNYDVPFTKDAILKNLLSRNNIALVVNEDEKLLHKLALSAAQPWLKARFFSPEFTQDEFDSIVKRVLETNFDFLKQIEEEYYVKF